MTNILLASQASPADRKAAPRWPALAAAWYIGIFCLVAGVAVAWNVASGSPAEANGTVLLAIGLRLVTIALALASVWTIGRRAPAWLLLAGLWGAAATQLVYPIAESVVKTLILVGAMEPIHKGISNMSLEGWFNFAGVWVIWGIPGILFALAAASYRRRVTVQDRWVLLGVLGGAVFLFGLGALIG
jgi:hypothetical protein